jgi:hypothetical protein
MMMNRRSALEQISIISGMALSSLLLSSSTTTANADAATTTDDDDDDDDDNENNVLDEDGYEKETNIIHRQQSRNRVGCRPKDGSTGS